MYLPNHFDEQRPEVLQRLIHDAPLGLLVTHGSAGLQANSVPFLLDADAGPHGTLRAHVARANPLWREGAGREALVVFQGPQAYVSPGWYPSKAEHGKVVPTWNYVMVQARGTLRAIDDAAWLRGLVTRLTAKPAPGQASIEAFFTRKGDAIYAVLPRWPGRRFVWKDAAPLRPKAVSLLGAAGALRFAKSGETIAIDLPDLPEELLGQPAWVLKLVR